MVYVGYDPGSGEFRTIPDTSGGTPLEIDRKACVAVHIEARSTRATAANSTGLRVC